MWGKMKEKSFKLFSVVDVPSDDEATLTTEQTIEDW